MKCRFYRIDARPLTPWGDYGHILQHGMTAHLPRTEGLLSLERTGPYMPPITFPGIGDVVLTSATKELLASSRLDGFTFQPVHKAKIVELLWHEWDLTTDEPAEFPESGEPEDYILERPSSAQVALSLGALWELVVPTTAIIGRPRRIVESYRELYVETESWNGASVFRGSDFGAVLVTEGAKDWLEQNLAGHLEFEEFDSR